MIFLLISHFLICLVLAQIRYKMPPTLPLHKRYEIIFLHIHPNGPKWGVSKVAQHMKCSTSTVQHWISRYEKNKNLSDFQKEGRPRSTSAREDNLLLQIAGRDTVGTSSGIQEKLERRGVNISKSTIQRRLREAKWKYHNPLLKPLLSNGHRINRVGWAEKHRNFDWSSVIFTDETTFYLTSSGRKTWQSPLKRKMQRTVKFPQKLNAWGAFSAQGFGKLICFTENLNAELLCSIYERGLLSTALEQFGPKPGSWTLQEDNDPKHTSTLAKEWRVKHNVRRMEWPSMSPDLNPIENVWSVLKVKVAKRHPKTLFGLRAVVQEEWRSMSTEFAERLSDSMEDRLSSVLMSEGDFILY